MKMQFNRRQAEIKARKAKQKRSPMPPPDGMLYTFMTNPDPPKSRAPGKLAGVWRAKPCSPLRAACAICA
jgi:hypothetical protein